MKTVSMSLDEYQKDLDEAKQKGCDEAGARIATALEAFQKKDFNECRLIVCEDHTHRTTDRILRALNIAESQIVDLGEATVAPVVREVTLDYGHRKEKVNWAVRKK